MEKKGYINNTLKITKQKRKYSLIREQSKAGAAVNRHFFQT